MSNLRYLDFVNENWVYISKTWDDNDEVLCPFIAEENT